ncbi:MAG: S8 family serine peptidase [Cytophagaceae bacterium]
MKRRISLFFVLLLIAVTSYSQNPKSGKKDFPAINKEKGYLENTVLFMLKPQVANNENARKNLNSEFKKYLKNADITELKQKFPGCKPKKQMNGKFIAPDVSRIYSITFKGNRSVEEVIQDLLRSGLVEYAEPHYVPFVASSYIPNDPMAQPGQKQDHLSRIKAFEAWDLWKGDTNMVIGIIDTGCNINHLDLKDNIKYNWADPIDGVDNDGDGFVDNFAGWDFGDNDNDVAANGHVHGTFVSGYSSATTDNGTGIAGSGFKCKFMPIKASPDAAGGALIYGYDGVMYAALKGCKVINLSWGGPSSYSQTNQNIINFAALEHDALIVAAAGNDNMEVDFYPASYDNVLSVASTDTTTLNGKLVDRKAAFSNYSTSVDICVHGSQMMSTANDGVSYNAYNGTSFSTPVVAGAAGIVRSRFPELSGLQVAELLRVTATNIDTISINASFNEKMGKGMLNMYAALTETTSPAVRQVSNKFYGKSGKFAFNNDTISIIGKYVNFLFPASNVVATLTCNSPFITILNNTSVLGAMGIMDTVENTADRFRVYLHDNIPPDTRLKFRLGFTDNATNYTDYQYFSIVVNPNYRIVDTNKVALTVCGNSRLAYVDGHSEIGEGFEFENSSMIFECGLMVGINSTNVSDCVRGAVGNTDNDFTNTKSIRFTSKSHSDLETFAAFQDMNRATVNVKQRTYAWQNDQYVMVEYQITNLSTETRDIYAGLFTDWDIMDYNQNRADWDEDSKVGYAYSSQANGLYGGVALLTKDAPACFSMDHFNAGGNNINPNSGFSSSRKFTTLSSGIGRKQAGVQGSGADVSQVVGTRLIAVEPNETRTIAFAIIGAKNFYEIKVAADQARNKFQSMKTSPTPTVSHFQFCKGDTADVQITPGNGSLFNFYNNTPPASPGHTGSQLLLTDVSSQRTIYVTGIDSLYESNHVAVNINFNTSTIADFMLLPDSINLSETNRVYYVDESSNIASRKWTLPDGSQPSSSIATNTFSIPGDYKVFLEVTGPDGCKDTISKIVKVRLITGMEQLSEDDILFYPNPADDFLKVQIKTSSPEKTEIEISNAIGTVVHREKLQDSKTEINIVDLTRGIYFVKISNGEKTIIKKFFKN